MKRKLTPILLTASLAVLFFSCEKEQEPDPVVLVTYEKDIKPIFVTNCTPCHLSGGANPNKWDNYATAKSKINNILDRVQREPGTTGFMPLNGKEKISAENINKLKQWMSDGLLEN